MDFYSLLLSDNMTYYKNIISILDNIEAETVYKRKNKKNYYYYNICASFDIETSSFYIENGKTVSNKEAKNKTKKGSIMYLWGFCIEGYSFYGRTWEEFKDLINIISNYFNTNLNKRLVIYVHNLSFEFQFMRKQFKWAEVFATDVRKVLYCCNTRGIEFRCSYFLSNANLDTVGKNLTKYKLKKLVGDLDYTLIRHYKTNIDSKELKYLDNDVKLVVAYIKEVLEETKNHKITQIPYTNTGFVRDFIKDKIRNNKREYNMLMKDLQIDDDSYNLLKNEFMGGFTHASGQKVGKVYKNVNSRDFTSSYPYVMLSEKFPMGKFKDIDCRKLTEADFIKYMKCYGCNILIEYTNIEDSFRYEHYISKSKCLIADNCLVDNGRIVTGDKVTLYINEIDFDIIKKCYKYDSFRVLKLQIAAKDYLPKEFIESILNFYKDKTELKGIESEIVDYMRKKGMLNSLYGMMVMDIIRPELTIDDNDEWIKKAGSNSQLEKYNKSSTRFTYYAWGIWVTAYARRNLWSGIYELKEDYIYSDTDSVKFLNYENHKEYFNNYNKIVKIKLQEMLKRYPQFSFSDFEPKDIKGKRHLIGVWDEEPSYKRFKTLGAKRYLVETSTGEMVGTISGVSKKAFSKLQLKYDNDSLFDMFEDGMLFDSDITGKLVHTYIDDFLGLDITDYKGETIYQEEKSGVHLDSTTYELTLSDEYLKYIKLFII